MEAVEEGLNALAEQPSRPPTRPSESATSARTSSILFSTRRTSDLSPARGPRSARGARARRQERHRADAEEFAARLADLAGAPPRPA
jgi:hypothetical protein